MSGSRKSVKRKTAKGRLLKKAPTGSTSATNRRGHYKATGTIRKGKKPALGPIDRRLSLIAQVTGAVVGSMPLLQQAKEMARQVCSVFGVDACVIRVLEEEELVLLASAGIPKGTLFPRIPTTWGVTQKILSRRQPILVPNVHTNAVTAPVTDHLRRPYPFTSYAGTPLIARDRVIGILGIYWVNEIRDFGKADLGHLQILGNSIAAAITNDRLYEEMRCQRDRLKSETVERKRADDKLRESEKRFQLAMEAAEEGLFDWHIPTNRIYRNPNCYAMLGYQPGEIAETIEGWTEFLHPDDKAAIVGGVQATRGGERNAYEAEYRFRAKDGQWMWLRTRGKVVERDAEGRAVRVMGTHVDITEHKRTEEQLKVSERKYRRLHESMMDAFVCVDMAGRITEFNEVYRQMLGYEQDELLSLTYRDLTPEQWHESEAAIIDMQVLPRGFSDIYEKEYRRKNGTVFPIELRTILLADVHGVPIGMWAMIRDITDRKRAEEALRESENAHLDQMRRLARDAKKLLEVERANVSRQLHDGVGQSLTSLMMRLAWVEKRIRTIDSALGDELNQACEQAGQMIDDIRNIAKGLRPVAIEHDGLIPAIRSYVTEFQRLSGIKCRVFVRPADLTVKEPPATAVFRIIQEAMTNVTRHARASRCDIRLNASHNQLELTVQDDGRGAKRGVLDGHHSLGILGMKERASAVGGDVWVENRPKAGVLVKASFPLRVRKKTHTP